MKVWVWVRVPIQALYAAVEALKARSAARHLRAAQTRQAEAAARERTEADADDQHAEDLKTGLREYGQGELPPKD